MVRVNILKKNANWFLTDIVQARILVDRIYLE